MFTFKNHKWSAGEEDHDYTNASSSNHTSEKRATQSTRRISGSNRVNMSVDNVVVHYSASPISVIGINACSPASHRDNLTSLRGNNRGYVSRSLDVGALSENRRRYTSCRVAPHRRRRLRDCQDIDKLITRCKEEEEGMEQKKCDDTAATKVQCTKRAKRIGWAVRKYIASMSGEDWAHANSINTLLSIKDTHKAIEASLFNSEMVNKLKKGMAKRSVFLRGQGKRTLWKPQHYVPSRHVVLANSIDELNNLYKVEGSKK